MTIAIASGSEDREFDPRKCIISIDAILLPTYGLGINRTFVSGRLGEVAKV
jgi:hypothetical protein